MTLVRNVVVACALVAACKSKGDSAAGGAGSLPDELAAFMPANAAELFQGAWQTRISFYQARSLDVASALEIKGETAHASDGTTDHPLTFELDSPCQFVLHEAIKDGSVNYDKHYLVSGGKLVAGDGAAGYRKGKQAVVCQIGPDSLVTSDAKGTCKSWKRDFMHKDKWESKPIECAWATKDGKDTFTAGKPGDNWASTLVADGDLLWSDQLRQEVKEERYMKRADFAAAKTWAADTNKAKDK